MSFVCLCCDTAAAHKHSKRYPSTTSSRNAKWVICSDENCQKTQKYSCAIAFCCRIKGKVPKTIYEANPWVRHMMPHVSSPMLSGNRTVPHCISCMHSSCFSIDIKPSLKKEPYPVPLPDLDVAYFDLESDEDDDTDNEVGTKDSLSKRAKHYPTSSLTLRDDSMQYLSNYKSLKTVSYNYLRKNTAEMLSV